MYIDKEVIDKHLSSRTFRQVSEAADELGLEAYVIGGYVRDIFLRRPSKDIDIVAVGSGIELAKAVARKMGRNAHLSVFKNFGTAQVKLGDIELEFVGARKESYTRDSRKPIVEDGTLEDDQNRRDFTINALALCLNASRYGELVDPFDGLGDMDRLTIRTPLDPDITFSDDPLRMMRAVRFATQLGFDIDPVTFEAIERNKERIDIISRERIIDELNKIILSPRPSVGFVLLDACGLLPIIFPELHALKGVETKEGNLLELAVEAARVRATLGEISYACEKIVGRYKAVIRTISGVYSSESKNDADFKRACELADKFAKKEGRQPRIMIAKMGQDGHDRGAKVVATGYADCGFDVDMGPLFQTPAEAAREAVENDVHVVGVSSLAAGHKTLIPQIIEELKKLGREDIIVIAGGVIPAQDYDFLYKSGVAAIFGPGSPVAKAACQILEILMED